MATKSKKSTRTKRQLKTDINREFDGEGVRKALLAALEVLYGDFPHLTLAQYLVSLEVLVAEAEGSPHTLVSLVKKLNMPYSTASRVVWSLTSEGGEVGVLMYERHPTDRRKKYLVIDPDGPDPMVPKVLSKVLIDYYGDSVRRLKSVAG
jgi:DNA-binding MarR family transcriptional regulator